MTFPRERICVGWKPNEIQVGIVRKTKQCIAVQIHVVNVHFLLVAVCDLHTIVDRKSL